MTVYNPNIPQANDDPTLSQAALIGNFGKVNTDFAINHVALTAGSSNGFHTKVTFPSPLGADPVLSGTQGAVYPKAIGGLTELFFNNATNVYQLTNLTPATNITALQEAYGFTTPWGLIINVGRTLNSAVTTWNLATDITTAYAAFITPITTASEFRVTAVNTGAGSNITWSRTPATNFYVLVIGA